MLQMSCFVVILVSVVSSSTWCRLDVGHMQVVNLSYAAPNCRASFSDVGALLVCRSEMQSGNANTLMAIEAKGGP